MGIAALPQKGAPRKHWQHCCMVAVVDMVAVMNHMTSVSTPFFDPVDDDFMKNFTTKILYSINVFSGKLHTYPILIFLILLF